MSPAIRDPEAQSSRPSHPPISGTALDNENGPASSTREPRITRFCISPIPPLLVENQGSDCRDHCANERTFLSYLRLAVNLAVISVAITLSFHLKRTPTPLELQLAKPLGAIFWVLAFLSLVIGGGNYLRTMKKYSQRAAIVQTGLKTQLVMGMTAFCIIGTCVIFLVIDRIREK